MLLRDTMLLRTGLAWDAMLLITGVELVLLKENDMHLFFERGYPRKPICYFFFYDLFFEGGIRGGQSVIFNHYAEANNQYMKDYDGNMEKSFISY